jgi:cell division protein FtsL
LREKRYEVMGYSVRAKSVSIRSVVPLPKIWGSGWALRVVAASFCMAGALMLTASRIETTKLQYELNGLHRQRQELSADVGRLELELANLARPQRIAQLAFQEGLRDPQRGQIIVMDD